MLMSSPVRFYIAVFANRLENRLRGFPPRWSMSWFLSPHFSDLKRPLIFQHHGHDFSHMAVESQRGLTSCPPQQSSRSAMAAMFLKASAEKWTCCLILLFLRAIERSGWLRSVFSQSKEHVCACACVCPRRVLPDISTFEVRLIISSERPLTATATLQSCRSMLISCLLWLCTKTNGETESTKHMDWVWKEQT